MNGQKELTQDQEKQLLKLMRLLNCILEADDVDVLNGAKLQRIIKMDRDRSNVFVDISIRLKI
jgi:hypothetical protein